jgi:DcaP outer membrane protein
VGRLPSAVFALALLPGVAQASDADLKTLETRMAAMQRMIEQLQAQVATLKGEPHAAAPSPGPVVAPSPPQSPPTADLDEVRGDALSVARVDNAPLDPTRKGFIDLPGTDAAFSLGGYAKLDAIFDPRRAGNADKFVTSSIPVGVPANGGYNNFNVHARQTRLDLNLIKGTQSTKGGPLRFFVEADFFGSAGDSVFHMRHAYGSKANLLLGWTWSALADPDAFPDTLDFEMAPGPRRTASPRSGTPRPLETTATPASRSRSKSPRQTSPTRA